jgi:hypothetical protein
MANILQHAIDCKLLLGNGYEEVHHYLDQYAKIFNPELFLDYHRTFLHNSYGLEIIRNLYGEEGKKAAIIHLTRDYGDTCINLEKVLKDFNRKLLWFDKLSTEYNPKPHVIRGWNNRALIERMKSINNLIERNVL